MLIIGMQVAWGSQVLNLGPKLATALIFKGNQSVNIKEFAEFTLGNLSENCWENKVNQ